MPSDYKFLFLLMVSLNFVSAEAEPRSSIQEICLKALNPVSKEDALLLPKIKTGGRPDPIFHALNAPELLAALKEKGELEFRLSELRKNPPLSKLCSEKMNVCFVIVESKRRWIFGKSQIVLKGADGKWFNVTAKQPIFFGDRAKMLVDFGNYKYVDSSPEDFHNEISEIREIYQREYFDEKTIQELTDYLFVRQINRSSNFKAAEGENREEFSNAIREANKILVTQLIKGEPLDRETLRQVNFLAHRGINPYGNADKANLAGAIRGTNDHVITTREGELRRLDLSEFQVLQSGGNGAVMNEFLPASQVPAAFDAWLMKVNRLGPQSDPIEVFTLYKELVSIHPFPDGNGRTSRMSLNYMLLKVGLPPLEFPSESMYFRPEDLLRRYIKTFKKKSALDSAFKGSVTKKIDFFQMRSFTDVKDMDVLADSVRKEFNLEKATLEHLHGTSGYIFVGTYKGRYIQFESTSAGEALSDSLGVMVSRSMKIIDEQEEVAKLMKVNPPTYSVYPELLPQKKNYHFLYEREFLKKKFEALHGRAPLGDEIRSIETQAELKLESVLARSANATSDRIFFDVVMQTNKVPDSVKTIEEVVGKILKITAVPFREKIKTAMTKKSSDEIKAAFVQVYNAFNSQKFDSFMSEVVLDALKLCRKSGECADDQRWGIPDKFLAQVLKSSADELGVSVETISRYAGREPGRLYFQRIQRGSLIFDDGAPGNHGMMPHALQNLFIYRELGKEKGQSFFKEMSGWVYERMFDSNAAFTPIPSTRDITRRHYWTGVLKAGNRSEISKMGALIGESGTYSGFLRENGLDLVAVEEKTKDLLNDGSVVRARYKGKEFTFLIDRDGVPESAAAGMVRSIKNQMDKNLNH